MSVVEDPTIFEPTRATRRAFLYCTEEPDRVVWVGQIEHEGSFKELIQNHCSVHGDRHADFIHVVVEGSPQWVEAVGMVAERAQLSVDPNYLIECFETKGWVNQDIGRALHRVWGL